MTAITLITVGLADYPNEPGWKVAAATDSRKTVEDLFLAHGIPIEDWSPMATSDQINTALGKWIERVGESNLVYWAGHGEYSGFGYRLALANSTAPLTAANALTGGMLSAALRDHLARRGDEPDWVLLILDTCGSYEGLDEVYRELKRPENFGIIATIEPGAAYAGTFASNLRAALAGFTGNDTAGIPLRELARRLEDAGHEVAAKFAPAALLPSHVDAPPPAQATLADYAELTAVLRDASKEVRNHFYAKARGAEINEPAWYFAGRVDERRQVAKWLRDAPVGMFVVSGVAGSGKSALLGMLLATSDPAVTAALEHAGHEPIPGDLRPGDLAFDAVVHLRGLTIGETVTALADSLRLDEVHGTDDLIRRARRWPTAGRRTILVDALDESRDPLTIATLLRQLATAPGTRVLVGTRQSLHEDPDQPTPPDSDILTILAADRANILKLQRDPDAVRTYVTKRLQRRGLPELGTPPAAIADTIAEFPQPFLFARLAVHEIIARPAWADSAQSLAELLGASHRGIFGRAVQRLSDTEPHVEALLHVLAYARGSGFPRTGGIWALAASAVAGTTITDREVAQAIELAAPYIMIDTEFGQSAYRLVHRTFVEWYLRADGALT
jgi:hypothetical protein